MTYPPPLLINVENVPFFFSTKREKNHLIINIVSGREEDGREELASYPNFFVVVVAASSTDVSFLSFFFS